MNLEPLSISLPLLLMPDYREPAQLVSEECAYTFAVALGIENVLNLSSLKSYASEVLARHRWYLYVRPCCSNRSFHAYHATQGCASSWEFLITLDLEWDVIRGRRSYQRTFWVCNDRPLVSHLPLGADFRGC